MAAFTRLSALILCQLLLQQLSEIYGDCDPKQDYYRCIEEKVGQRCWSYPYNDIWFWQSLFSCPAHYLCMNTDERSVTCIRATKCVQPGRFPDVDTDRCTWFYDCPEEADDDNIITILPKECPSGFQYNPCSRKCDISYNGTCRVEYSACSGSPSVLPDNPSLFYSCANSFKVPYWHKCEEGFFLEQLGQCIGTGQICP